MAALLPAIGLLVLLPAAPIAHARNMMSADGPGGTYELLQRAYSTELPDCGHMVPHITEELDNELKKNVFVFHAHVNQDDDRCRGFDRQRTEIRARAADIVANQGETVFYRWKFKLDAGFRGSNRFTHIFQIKSDLGAPIMTLTPRVSSFGTTGRVGSSGTTDLAKFLGVWVVVDLEVLYSNAGRTETTIRRLSDGAVLFSQAGNADMWDDNASGHDSKFGIYRSLESKELLRDEQVRFADFCASKVSAAECQDDAATTSDAGPPAGGTDGGAGGAGGADAGGAGGAGGVGGSGGTGGRTDAATSTPPPPRTDASAGPARADARPAMEPEPQPSEPTPRTPAKAPGCSCSVGAAPGGAERGAAAVAFLYACALTLMRRRPRR